ERPTVKGALQPIAAHRALREIGPQVGTLRIDGVRVPARIAINGNPPVTELGRTNLPPPDRPGSRQHVPRLRHSSRARKEFCHETATMSARCGFILGLVCRVARGKRLYRFPNEQADTNLRSRPC